MPRNSINTSWYAIRLNNVYWMGNKSVDPTGNVGIVCPSISGAILLPTNADDDSINRFRRLAKDHGGQLVQLDLNISVCVDEMLQSQFGKIPDTNEYENDEDEDSNNGEKFTL